MCHFVSFLVVITSAIDCLERLLSEMTYHLSSGKLNPTRSCHSAYAFFCIEIYGQTDNMLVPDTRYSILSAAAVPILIPIRILEMTSPIA